MRRPQDCGERLVERLLEHKGASLLKRDGQYALLLDGVATQTKVPPSAVRKLLSRGLLVECEVGRYVAAEAAKAWKKRSDSPADPFRMQQGTIEPVQARDGSDADVLVNIDESPIGALASRSHRNGKAWLAPHAVAAAERLRRDFELGQLQPRVTANWSASVATRRRTGESSGLANLTEAAVGARLRFDHAMRAVGPELSGILVDICCFLKGVETVERERQWPARSAKLVLRLALERLARHYGYSGEATGPMQSKKLRHWGADDYRPTVR